MVELSPMQTKAFDEVMSWFSSDRKTFALAGYAGAGKTTLAKTIDEAVGGGSSFCAYTGKAANVLRDKGCVGAGTIHGSLYALIDHDRQQLLDLESEIAHSKEAGNFDLVDKLRDQLADMRMKMRRPRFGLNPDSPLRYAPLVIVDEYSMLPAKLIADLESVGTKILYIGDPFQLPPVEGECPIKPNFFIDEIHRQALDSPIVRYSTQVRLGNQLSYVDEPGFKYAPKNQVAAEEYLMAEQLIVGRNNTRTAWNNRFRERRGVEINRETGRAPLPLAGEKLICLKNNPELELFNGMIGLAADNARHVDGLRYILDFDDKPSLNVWMGDVSGQGEKYDGYNETHRKLERFDFGYAITCHKSQGSEFDSVVIYNEPIGRGEERARWLYTAITRAKNKVVLVDPPR